MWRPAAAALIAAVTLHTGWASSRAQESQAIVDNSIDSHSIGAALASLARSSVEVQRRLTGTAG